MLFDRWLRALDSALASFGAARGRIALGNAKSSARLLCPSERFHEFSGWDTAYVRVDAVVVLSPDTSATALGNARAWESVRACDELPRSLVLALAAPDMPNLTRGHWADGTRRSGQHPNTTTKSHTAMGLGTAIRTTTRFGNVVGLVMSGRMVAEPSTLWVRTIERVEFGRCTTTAGCEMFQSSRDGEKEGEERKNANRRGERKEVKEMRGKVCLYIVVVGRRRVGSLVGMAFRFFGVFEDSLLRLVSVPRQHFLDLLLAAACKSLFKRVFVPPDSLAVTASDGHGFLVLLQLVALRTCWSHVPRSFPARVQRHGRRCREVVLVTTRMLFLSTTLDHRNHCLWRTRGLWAVPSFFAQGSSGFSSVFRCIVWSGCRARRARASGLHVMFGCADWTSYEEWNFLCGETVKARGHERLSMSLS